MRNFEIENEGNLPSLPVETGDEKTRDGKKRHRTGNGTKIDLALPSVVISSSHTNRRRKKQWGQYRFLASLAICLTLTFQFIHRTILRLPDGEKRLDVSNVKSVEHLSVDAIDSWCLSEDEESCSCSDPLQPEGRQEDPRWEKVHHLNVDNISSKGLRNLDVVFLGDSITEGWTGNFYHAPDSRVQGSLTVFQSFFSKRHGGKYEGLTQGIAGDAIPALLWRIQNGEIGRQRGFQKRMAATPFPVFWLLIGTNDLGNSRCSPDVVILGIVRIVEELLKRVPISVVVINGILPRTFDRAGYVMQSQGESPTLWPVIKTINTELERYASKRDRVEYFETEVFLKDNSFSDKGLRIDPVLMTDYLHPSAAGYRKWGNEIVHKLDSIFTDPKNAVDPAEKIDGQENVR